jgi:hypothetical protein
VVRREVDGVIAREKRCATLPGTRGSSGPGGTAGLALATGLHQSFPRTTHSISTNNPPDSVPVSRSSTIPPGLTRRNHLSRCLPLSGISVVMGYAVVMVQSATERETSSWSESVDVCVLPLRVTLGLPRVRRSGAYTALFGVENVDLGPDGARAEEEPSSTLVVYDICIVRLSHTMGSNPHLVNTSFGPSCLPVKVCLKVVGCVLLSMDASRESSPKHTHLDL